MLKRRRVTLVLGVLLFAAIAVQAQPSRWSLRLRTLASNYEHEFVAPYTTTTYLNVQDGSGFEASAELRHSQHFGIELSAGRLNMDARLRTTQLQPISFDPIVLREVTIFSSEGDFAINPFSLAVLYHPLRQGRFDLYAGPAIAWVRYDVDIEGAQDRDPEAGYGVKLGGAYLFGRSPWSLGFEYRHLELLHEATDRDLYGDIGLDVGALVVGYRFGGHDRTP